MATDQLDLATYGRLRAAGVPHTEAIAAATAKAAPPKKQPPVIRAPTARERVLGRLQDLVEGTLVPDLDTAAPVPPAPRGGLLGGPSATMRAATPTERFTGTVRDLVAAVAGSPLGKLSDAVGLTDFAGFEDAATNPEHVAMGMPDPPAGRALTGLVKGAPRGGFFSRVDDAVRLLPAKGAHPNKVASLLKSNASAEELAHRKVPEFLASQGNAPVTPAQLQAHLAAHPAPVPTVKTLGEPRPAPTPTPVDTTHWAVTQGPNERWKVTDTATGEIQGYVFHGDPGGGGARTAAEAQDIVRDRITLQEREAAAKVGQPKYAQYQLPGGEAYRETLLTLPEQPPQDLPPGYSIKPVVGNPNVKFTLETPDGSGYALGATTAEQAYPNALAVLHDKGVLPPPQNFRSGHFDDPNLLVHTRSNARTLPTGERGRFVEEVQSDWHQAGKKRGYGPEQRVIAYYDSPEGTPIPLGYGKTEAEALANADPGWKKLVDVKYRTEATGQVGVPDAPFKETWPDLGLKQQLLETAADPQASWLGFTSGKMQAARYDLSKQIDGLQWVDWPAAGKDHGLLVAFKDGQQVIKETIPRDKLGDYIGKEPATKLLAQQGGAGGVRELSGVDLQVGGEGMRHFYDQVLPKRLEKILKPFGGTVESMPLTPNRMTKTGAGEFVDEKTMAWIAKLTPEMKARILKDGLPLLTLPLAALLGPAAGAESKP